MIEELKQEIKLLKTKVERYKDAEELLSTANNILLNKNLFIDDVVKKICKINYEQTEKNFVIERKRLDKSLKLTVSKITENYREERQSFADAFMKFLKEQHLFNNAFILILQTNGIDVSSIYPIANKLHLPIKTININKIEEKKLIKKRK